MISDIALGKISNQIGAMIARAEICVDGVWTRIKTALEKDVAAGSISVIVRIGEEQPVGVTVTGIRLLDTNADVFAEKTVEITRADSASGYAYQYALAVVTSDEEG